VSEAARILGVHVNTLRTWTDQGRLRCVRANPRGDRRYRRDDLDALLSVMRIGPESAGAFQPRLVPRERRSVEWALAAPGVAPAGSAIDAADADAIRPAAESGRPVVPFPVRPRPAAAGSEAGADATLADAMADLATTTSRSADLAAALRAATRVLRDPARFRMIAIGEWRNGVLEPRSIDGVHRARAWWAGLDLELAAIARREGRQVAGVTDRQAADARRGDPQAGAFHLFTPIGSGEGAWGTLIAELPSAEDADRRTLELLSLTAGILELATRRAGIHDRAAGEESRWRLMAEVAADLGARTELPVLLERLVDHGRRPFGADHAVAVLPGRDGSREATASHAMPESLVGALALAAGSGPLAAALATGRPVAILQPRQDPRAAELAPALVRAGIGSLVAVPLGAEGGMLVLAHAVSHPWSADELEMVESLAAQASVAIRNARDLARMTGWAAQLASIRALGARLNRYLSVEEIGRAICRELRELLPSDDVRVYRVSGEELVPVAWQGMRDPYRTVDGERLRTRVGEGITGWVVRHGSPAILGDAARDPRARTVPGTSDLDESMLLAPMRDDERTIGVIVLSRIGLHRFDDDDLRTLEIYAAMAAQAMVNADATERLRAQSRHLERQLETQRELLRVTESILSSLDPRRVVDEITARLGALVPVDSLSVQLRDPDPVDGVRLLEDRAGTWARIVAPLRRRDGGLGTLRLERRGRGARFEPWEVELVTLFAGQVSIALANAVAHREVEERARTDALTGLRNQGAFQDDLARAVSDGRPFGLLMIDLDDFKSWNDAHGHEAGNRLLEAIGRELQAACRETDRVYRYGGDEFSILLPEASGRTAVEVAERLPGAVRAASGDRVSCSIGIAAFPADGGDAETIVLAADRACYVAKRAGGSRAAIAEEGLSPEAPAPADGSDDRGTHAA